MLGLPATDTRVNYPESSGRTDQRSSFCAHLGPHPSLNHQQKRLGKAAKGSSLSPGVEPFGTIRVIKM